MSLIALIRPGDWDLPLFVHVLGAMMLVGAAVAGVSMAFVTSPAGTQEWARRLAFRTFLIVALPAFIVMRFGAEWMRIKEFGEAATNPAWVILGYSTADGGGVLLIVGIILAGIAARRGRPRLAKIAAAIVGLALIGWVITAWAMAAKPG